MWVKYDFGPSIEQGIVDLDNIEITRPAVTTDFYIEFESERNARCWSGDDCIGLVKGLTQKVFQEAARQATKTGVTDLTIANLRKISATLRRPRTRKASRSPS